MKNKGFNANRLNDKEFNSRELAFAKAWDKENSHDLNPEDGYLGKNLLEYLVPNPTERDYQVAATVIQWLGSNVGISFLAEVINKDPKIKKYLEANT